MNTKTQWESTVETIANNAKNATCDGLVVTSTGRWERVSVLIATGRVTEARCVLNQYEERDPGNLRTVEVIGPIDCVDVASELEQCDRDSIDFLEIGQVFSVEVREGNEWRHVHSVYDLLDESPAN